MGGPLPSRASRPGQDSGNIRAPHAVSVGCPRSHTVLAGRQGDIHLQDGLPCAIERDLPIPCLDQDSVAEQAHVPHAAPCRVIAVRPGLGRLHSDMRGPRGCGTSRPLGISERQLHLRRAGVEGRDIAAGPRRPAAQDRHQQPGAKQIGQEAFQGNGLSLAEAPAREPSQPFGRAVEGTIGRNHHPVVRQLAGEEKSRHPARGDLPQPGRAIGAPGGEPFAIGAEGDRLDLGVMTFQGPHFTPVAWQPELQGPFRPGGGQIAPAGIESKGVDVSGVARERSQRLTRRDRPDPDAPVSPARGEPVSVAAESESGHSPPVARQQAHVPAIKEVSQLDGVLRPWGGHPAVVHAHGDILRFLGVAGEGADPDTRDELP